MRSQEVDTLEGRLSQNEEETMHSLCVQALRLCTEMEGTTSLISRSDCRKGLRWKSAEVEDPSSFMAAANEVLESPAQGFNCRMENNGAISCVYLTRFSFEPQKKSIWALFLHVRQNVALPASPAMQKSTHALSKRWLSKPWTSLILKCNCMTVIVAPSADLRLGNWHKATAALQMLV